MGLSLIKDEQFRHNIFAFQCSGHIFPYVFQVTVDLTFFPQFTSVSFKFINETVPLR